MLGVIVKALRRIIAHLFQVQVGDVRCVSQVGEQVITLTREFVKGAQHLNVEFTIQWPLFRRWVKPGISINLLDPAGGILGEKIDSDGRHARSGKKIPTRILVPVPSAIQQGAFRLLVIHKMTGKRLEEFSFTMLDADRLSREFKASELEIYALLSNRRVPAERFHDQIQDLEFSLRLEVDNAEHRSLFNQLKGQIEARLLNSKTPANQVAAWRQPFRFEGRSFSWTERISQAPALFKGNPGEYCLGFYLGNSVVALKHFHIVPLEECRKAARNAVKEKAVVNKIEITAINHHENTVPLKIVAEDFHSLALTLAFTAPQPDPLLDKHDLVLSFALHYAEDETKIGGRTSTLTVSPGLNRHLDSFPLTPEIFRRGPGRYKVGVFLDDRLLSQQEFYHKTRDQIKKEKAAALLQSLVLSSPHLFVSREGQRVETTDVFESDQALMPVFAIQGEGFDDDAPALRWRLNMEIINLDADRTTTKFVYLKTREGKNAYDELEIPLQTAQQTLGPGHYRLRLLKLDQLLKEFDFRILSAEEIVSHTQQLVLASLRAEKQHLFVQTAGFRHEADNIAQTSDFLCPELTLCSNGFNSHLPRLKTRLELFITKARQKRLKLLECPITLAPEPTILKNLAIKISDTNLAATRGPCRLTVTIAQREIATFAFQIVSQEDLLQRITTQSIRINAKTTNGKVTGKPARLRLDTHQTIAPAVEIKVGILAPNVVFESSIVVLQGRTVLSYSNFDLRLDQAIQSVSLKPIKLADLEFQESLDVSELTIAVYVGDERKGALSLPLVVRQAIANFEGQLTSDPEASDLDEAKYQEIMRNLGH